MPVPSASLSRHRRVPRAWFVAAVVLLGSTVRADEVTGTWTGQVELRGNYFLERSTRVVAPYARVQLESPGGVEIMGDYLLDAISSASIAQTGSDEDRVFTEHRHAFGLGVAKEIEVGGLPLRLGAVGRFSREPDYVSRSLRLQGDLWLGQRATQLTFATGGVHDTVRSNRPFERDRSERLNVLSWSAGWSQLLTRLMTISVGYDVYYFRGFLANIYRPAPTTPPTPESHPATRWRHAIYGRWAHAIPATNSAIHLLYRHYIDSWDLSSHTPEVRWYQMFGEDWLLRLRYRYYTQTSSFFFEQAYLEPMRPRYVTGDPKMSRFDLHWVGFKLQRRLGLLRDTPLHFLHRGSGDLIVERYWNSNAFGHAWHAQVGLRVPF